MEPPEKLSDLLRLAVADAMAIEQTPGYVLNMHAWHIPVGTMCHVCLAGSVMARTLGAPRDEHLEPLDADEWYNALQAIDDMRAGEIAGTWEQRRRFGSIVDETYDHNVSRAMWETYLKAAEYLDKEGL